MKDSKGCCHIPADTVGGFTLIEVLLALSIFAIGILALGALQVRYISGNSLARNQTESLSIASDVIEQLMSIPAQQSAQLSAGNHGPYEFDGHKVTWEVTPDSPMQGIRSIVVRVYPSLRAGRVISFRYYISDTVPLSHFIESEAL